MSKDKSNNVKVAANGECYMSDKKIRAIAKRAKKAAEKEARTKFKVMPPKTAECGNIGSEIDKIEAAIYAKMAANGCVFAIHANATALDYGIYRPYYKSVADAEKHIKELKRTDKKNGWLMYYRVVILKPAEVWYNDLPHGDYFHDDHTDREVCDSGCGDLFMMVFREFSKREATCDFNAALVKKCEDGLRECGYEMFRYRDSWSGKNCLGLRAIGKWTH